jgi:hypothetical protein
MTTTDNTSGRGKKVLLIMTIDIGDGRNDLIEVRQNDKPEDLAKAFVKQHGLDPLIISPLAENIQANLASIPKKAITSNTQTGRKTTTPGKDRPTALAAPRQPRAKTWRTPTPGRSTTPGRNQMPSRSTTPHRAAKSTTAPPDVTSTSSFAEWEARNREWEAAKENSRNSTPGRTTTPRRVKTPSSHLTRPKEMPMEELDPDFTLTPRIDRRSQKMVENLMPPKRKADMPGSGLMYSTVPG